MLNEREGQSAQRDGEEATQDEASAEALTVDATTLENSVAGDAGVHRIDDDVPPMPSTPRDRWAHRRGEPRVFALFWTMFLLIATMGLLGGVLAGGVLSYDVYRPAARILLVIAMVGVGVAWPMTRLSQARPTEGPLSAAWRDVLAMCIPLQAIIWPQHWLAAWTWKPLLALAAAMCVWVVLVGGVLAFAMRGLAMRPAADVERVIHVPRQEGRRTTWMLAIVLMSVAVLPLRLVEATEPGSRSTVWTDLLGILSPVGAVLELSHDRAWSGTAIAVTQGHWLGIGVVAVAAAAMWLIAWGVGRDDVGPT